MAGGKGRKTKKQSVLDDYWKITMPELADLAEMQQKYIHYWDFMDHDKEAEDLQARIYLAVKNLKSELQVRYQEHYTNCFLDTPDKFVRHNQDLADLEYLVNEPLFLCALQLALDKELDPADIRKAGLELRERLELRRRLIKKDAEKTSLLPFMTP
jgi:hypothetical protein